MAEPDMITRVAEAIAGVPLAKLSRNDRRNALITARAAIEAMREPIEEMVDAAHLAWENTEGSINTFPPPELSWRAMIDRALITD